MSDNSVTIIGGVVNDPELKFLNSGSAAVKFSLAVDNGRMKDGEWQKKVSYFDVIAYGKMAENIAETLKKGYRACATGKFEQRSWQTDDGSKRYVIEMIADDVSVSLKFVTAELHRRESANRAPADEDPF